jgi:2-O-methyltransferase
MVQYGFRMTALLPPITPGAINLSHLQGLVGKAAQVILEVGANDGSHTLEFLKLFPNARIYAFEPDPRAFAKNSK